ncbi:MAG: hypothetical protein QM765_22160 [Myxococcales bacterium]
MHRKHASLLLLVVVALAGCRPAGPRRHRPSTHLALARMEKGEARFQIVDVSRAKPVFSQEIAVPDALTATQGSPREPLATNVGTELFVLVGRAGDAEIVRIPKSGARSRLRTSLKLQSAQLTPRPLRVVDGRLFLVTTTGILSTRLSEEREYLEPLDAAGLDHFATLSGDLVTAHDLRVGDPFDWQVLRLRGSGSLLPIGRLSGDLLKDVVARDGADQADHGVLFVTSGGALRSIFVEPGKRVTESEATLEGAEGGLGSLAVLDREASICSRRLFALPVAFDSNSRAREVDGASCQDLVGRGPVWVLGRKPQELVRIDLDGAGRAAVVARHLVPGDTKWEALVR